MKQISFQYASRRSPLPIRELLNLTTGALAANRASMKEQMERRHLAYGWNEAGKLPALQGFRRLTGESRRLLQNLNHEFLARDAACFPFPHLDGREGPAEPGKTARTARRYRFAPKLKSKS
jgi:hypothetical protein